MNSNTEDAQYPGEPGGPRSASLRQTRPQHCAGFSHKGARMIAGVCVAISRHFNVDVTIVRVTFAVLAIIGFTGLAYLGSLPLYLGGIPLYLACWVLIPGGRCRAFHRRGLRPVTAEPLPFLLTLVSHPAGSQPPCRTCRLMTCRHQPGRPVSRLLLSPGRMGRLPGCGAGHRIRHPARPAAAAT